MVRAVVFDTTGEPDVLVIRDVEVGEPGPGQVRIRVQAVGINRADQMLRTNTYAYVPATPAARIGAEAAGIIDAVGEGVDRFRVGDKVLAAGVVQMDRDGTYAEQTILPAGHVIHQPEGLDPITAAAIWVAYSTAYGGLIEKGGMRPGDHVVITAASSGVALAAIQIANHIGAVPIAVTRSDSKRQALLDAGAKHVIVSDTEDVAERVHAITGRGAEIIFDPIAGPGLAALAKAAAPAGLVVVYGWLDTRPAPLPMSWPIRVEGYVSFDTALDPATQRRTIAFLEAGLAAGTIVPRVDKVFAFEDIVEAHRYLESGNQFGKIVTTVQP